MKKRTSKFLASQIVRVNQNETEIHFFGESYKDEERVTKFKEQEIVKWLFNDDSIKDKILKEIFTFSVNKSSIHLEVKEPLLNKNEQKIIGDIDAVIIPNDALDKTIVIEFKRVKVTTQINKFVRTNKFFSLKKKGFSQIKKLRKFNYYKTFLGIIIEDDARYVKSSNSLLRSSKSEVINSIYEINFDNTLEDKAGLFIIKLTQPTGENINKRFNFEISLEKNATEIIQEHYIIERLKKLLNK